MSAKLLVFLNMFVWERVAESEVRPLWLVRMPHPFRFEGAELERVDKWSLLAWIVLDLIETGCLAGLVHIFSDLDQRDVAIQ